MILRYADKVKLGPHKASKVHHKAKNSKQKRSGQNPISEWNIRTHLN